MPVKEKAEMSVEAIESRQTERKEKFRSAGKPNSQQIEDIEWLMNELMAAQEKLGSLEEHVDDMSELFQGGAATDEETEEEDE